MSFCGHKPAPNAFSRRLTRLRPRCQLIVGDRYALKRFGVLCTDNRAWHSAGMPLRSRIFRNPRQVVLFEEDPHSTREHFVQLAAQKILDKRRLGLRPTTTPEDVAQTVMEIELAARARGAKAGYVLAYRSMEDDIVRSSSVAEVPVGVFHRAMQRGDCGVIRTFRRSTLPHDLEAEPSRTDQIIDNGDLRRVLSELPQRLMYVIEARYGIDHDQMSIAEIAQELGVSRQRVQQLEDKAVSFIRRRLSGLPARPRPLSPAPRTTRGHPARPKSEQTPFDPGISVSEIAAFVSKRTGVLVSTMKSETTGRAALIRHVCIFVASRLGVDSSDIAKYFKIARSSVSRFYAQVWNLIESDRDIARLVEDVMRSASSQTNRRTANRADV